MPLEVKSGRRNDAHSALEWCHRPRRLFGRCAESPARLALELRTGTVSAVVVGRCALYSGRVGGDGSFDRSGGRGGARDARKSSDTRRRDRCGKERSPSCDAQWICFGIESFTSERGQIALLGFDHGFDVATRLLVVVGTLGFHGDSL